MFLMQKKLILFLNEKFNIDNSLYVPGVLYINSCKLNLSYLYVNFFLLILYGFYLYVLPISRTNNLTNLYKCTIFLCMCIIYTNTFFLDSSAGKKLSLSFPSSSGKHPQDTNLLHLI